MTSQNAAEFRTFCLQATDSQLLNIFLREKNALRHDYAEIARVVGVARQLTWAQP